MLAPGGTLVDLGALRQRRSAGSAPPGSAGGARAVEAAGGKFYQYAFTRRELLGRARRHGFTAAAAHPYDPARPPLPLAPFPAGRGARCRGRSRGPAGAPEPAPGQTASRSARRLAALVRRALYTEPALRLLGHMLLVVARRP